MVSRQAQDCRSPLHVPVGVAADTTGIYWVTSGADEENGAGGVYFVADPGVPATTLSRGEPAPWSMTADADFVCWSDFDGLVFRVSKP